MKCIICQWSIDGIEVFGPANAPQCRPCYHLIQIESHDDIKAFERALKAYGEDARDRQFLKEVIDAAQ